MTPDAPNAAADVPALGAVSGWDGIFDGTARETLERVALPTFVRRQRWFGGKARAQQGVRVADWGRMPAEDAVAFAVIAEVKYADGGTDRYFLPLAIGAEPTGIGRDATTVVARVSGPDGDAVLFDAAADEGFCTHVLTAVGAGLESPTHDGYVRAVPTAAYARLRGEPSVPLPVRRGPATSSNSIVFFGDRLLLKLFRRLEAGTNPDVDVGRFLTESGRFGQTPGLAGWLEYDAAGGKTYTLGLLQAAVANRGDGWSDALAELARYYHRVAESEAEPDRSAGRRPVTELASGDVPAAVRTAVGDALRDAATLGRRTAEMHRALAANANDPAFAPEPLTAADADSLRHEIAAQARRGLEAITATKADVPANVTDAVRKLATGDGSAVEAFRDAVKTRVHGDYHLGQVLCVGGDFVVIDFEGEPTRTVEERRAKCSPVRDVAGMLRSYHYAAYAGLFAAIKDDPAAAARLEPWAEVWHRWVSAAFLREYLAAAGDAPFVPRRADDFARLLDGYTLAKALYELVYELNNRPDWVRIPLNGVAALLARRP